MPRWTLEHMDRVVNALSLTTTCYMTHAGRRHLMGLIDAEHRTWVEGPPPDGGGFSFRGIPVRALQALYADDHVLVRYGDNSAGLWDLITTRYVVLHDMIAAMWDEVDGIANQADDSDGSLLPPRPNPRSVSDYELWAGQLIPPIQWQSYNAQTSQQQGAPTGQAGQDPPTGGEDSITLRDTTVVTSPAIPEGTIYGIPAGINNDEIRTGNYLGQPRTTISNSLLFSNPIGADWARHTFRINGVTTVEREDTRGGTWGDMERSAEPMWRSGRS